LIENQTADNTDKSQVIFLRISAKMHFVEVGDVGSAQDAEPPSSGPIAALHAAKSNQLTRRKKRSTTHDSGVNGSRLPRNCLVFGQPSEAQEPLQACSRLLSKIRLYTRRAVAVFRNADLRNTVLHHLFAFILFQGLFRPFDRSAVPFLGHGAPPGIRFGKAI
jgi:hypothetical protein